jgi:hypothetical protein
MINVRQWGDEWLWSVYGEDNTKFLGEGKDATEALAWRAVCLFLGEGAKAAVLSLRARAEAAEAALATARAEGAAAERAAVVVWIMNCDNDDMYSGIGIASMLCDYISAGEHVRPVEGA